MSSTTILDKKDYRELLRKQTNIEMEVSTLKEAVLELSKDEIRPAIIKRLEKQSRILDEGGGRRLRSLKELKAYLKNV
ncbi:MAG: hypothetical protein HY454_01660 [Parcubacteria group bacterium]|nr:hypothetical protein [Parcubacteria group bacterium]